MKIIIEEYEYPLEVLNKHLKDYSKVFPNGKNVHNGKISTDEVGYYFNNEVNDCVFFLPKVVIHGKENDEENLQLDEENKTVKKPEEPQLVFGKYKPEDIIDLESSDIDQDIKDFLHQFSVWIYRAVNVYRAKNNKTNKSIKSKTISKQSDIGSSLSGTILDTILSLLDYYHANKDYLMFSIKNIHRGFNKINWPKTVGHQTPYIQKNGNVVYLHPINKKKQVDYEDDLYVLYYSILHYLKMQMGFPISLDLKFDYLSPQTIEFYRKGYGRSLLKNIKYRYFSDKDLQLWKLCYSFFDYSCQIASEALYEEYLVASKFEHVFEDIIDSLLADKNVPTCLKKQKDGKIVDHIYSYESLIKDPIYYIGDSKYYKMGHEVQGTQSEFKQYTYAKNVIQYNLELFMKRRKGYLSYRDELTEGYNITPNFFISGRINKEMLNYEESGLKPHIPEGKKTNTTLQEQFPNRLFDRDTLWLSHYDINFLFVISLYVRDNYYSITTFSSSAKKVFRDKIIEAIGSFYNFYILEYKEGSIADFRSAVHQMFWQLNGKIYRPFKDKKLLLLAILNNTTEEDKNIIFNNLELYFVKYDGYQLGSDILEFITGKKSKML